jgi:DNA repair protein
VLRAWNVPKPSGHMEGGFFRDSPSPPNVPGLPAAAAAPRRAAPPSSAAADDFDEEGEAALVELEREEAAPRPWMPEFASIGDSSGAGGATSRPRAGKCVECGEADGQAKFFEAFGVSACYDCQRAAKGPGGRYQVITKSKAKDEYLLSDRHLNREHSGLGCLVQPNPHDRRYGDMRLYLRSQVEELALSVWGSDEALFEEKDRRAEERRAKAAAKKRKAEGRGIGGAAPGRKGARGTAAGVSGGSALKRLATVAHTHAFLPDETYDEGRDVWTKRCACGFEVEYERM